MERKETQIPPIGTAVVPGGNDADILARQITEYLRDTSVEQIRDQIEQVQITMSRYRCALLEVETKFRVLNEQFSLQNERNPIESIKTRIKSPESIREKLERRGLPATLAAIEEKIHDVAGIRVICSFIDDIYLLADCLLGQDDVKLLRRKDYIAEPKENGYRSLHLIIEIPIFLHNEKRYMKVEVQLRTIAMEFWANLEHKLRYKKDLPEETANLIASELSACAEMSNILDRKMQGVRDIIAGS